MWVPCGYMKMAGAVVLEGINANMKGFHACYNLNDQQAYFAALMDSNPVHLSPTQTFFLTTAEHFVKKS